jgi:hypothetical protein
MEPDEIVMIDGMRVTSAARAVVDIARTAELESAVAPWRTRPCDFGHDASSGRHRAGSASGV